MVIGDRIKMARRMRGISQRDLARGAQVSATAISKYERNINVPSSGVLLRISKALSVKIEYFFRQDTFQIHVSSPSFRSMDLDRKDKAVVEETVKDWLERYVTVENFFEEGDTVQYAMPSGFPFRISNLNDIELAALKLRKKWNLGVDPIESFMDLLEDKGIKVGTVSAPESFDGVTFYYDHTPVIVVKKDSPGDRQRFTLAHELGHLVLNPLKDLNPEKVAHRFAGAFLVPADVVVFELGNTRSKLDLFELHLLKHKYGLSMQAWVHRAKDLGIISDEEYHRIFERFKKEGWRQVEPGDQIPPEEPKRMERLVMRAYAEDIISLSRASEILGKDLKEFCKGEEKKHGGFPIEMCN